jgi:hypothetical protein
VAVPFISFGNFELFVFERDILKQRYNNIVAVRFIGGGNQITGGKPPTCCKTLTNFIT